MATKVIAKPKNLILKAIQVGQFELPKIKVKKQFHTKDPYTIKKVKPPLPFETFKKRELNGFKILKFCKSELPHEIIKASLKGLNFVSVTEDDLKYFVNLQEVDISDSKLQINQLLNLPALSHLIMKNYASLIFHNLQILDVSYNQIDFQEIIKFQFIPQLSGLNLSGNELERLPESLECLQTLRILDLSSNNFSSNQYASKVWQSLATIASLTHLNLSRNKIKGIHTENLKAGNFAKLEILNFCYNHVENQHNLICARNFGNLKILEITGNPFALENEFRGLELEIYSRTGATLINEKVEKYYLKERKTFFEIHKKINFGNVIRLQNQIISKENRTYFFGVELPHFNEIMQLEKQEEEQKQISKFEPPKEEEEKIIEQKPSVEEQLQDEGEDQKFFITQEPIQQQKKQQQQQLEQQNQTQNILENVQKCKELNYNEYKQMCNQQFGGQKLYDNPLDITSAYKILKTIIRKPEDIPYQENTEPHYLSDTFAIQKNKRANESLSGSRFSQKQQFSQYNSKQNQKSQDLNQLDKILNNLNKNMKEHFKSEKQQLNQQQQSQISNQNKQ